MRSVVYKIGVLCLLALSAPAWIVINEVCYDNSTVADETGDTSADWIELYNEGTTPVNILNYGLGDANPYENNKGVRLPDYTIPPGGYLVVYASGDLPEYTLWTNAPDRELIAPNTVWHYRSVSGAPEASWINKTFNDAAWASGISPLGYNDAKENMDCATVLSYGDNPGNRYSTAYFRKTFAVANPAGVTGLVVRVRINDGAVVYLNGSEAFRQNMPEGHVTHTTLALMDVPTTQWVTLLLPTDGLEQGENVLAVEVHQVSGVSQDLIMDLTLTGLVNERVPVVHGQFSLAKEGENIHLFNSVLTRVHMFESPGFEVGEGKSYGASPDGSTSIHRIYSLPTPGLPNTSQTARYAETLVGQEPLFSLSSGAYATGRTVVLNTPLPGYKVYYTLDGSDPRDSATYVYNGRTVQINAAPPATSVLSWIRTNPVEISSRVPAAAWLPPIGTVDKGVVLRAITVSPDNKLCSPETRGTYFIGPQFTNRVLPVVSLITDTNNLFGFTSGIYVPGKHYADSSEDYGLNKWGKPYANYHQNDNGLISWERPVYFQLFETSHNAPAVSQLLGMVMYGGGTRAIPQKTLNLMARAREYGTDLINYPLFPDEAAPSYKRFLLRNSGNDWYGPDFAGVSTMMKDAVFHRMVKGLDLSVMAYRPTVAYINGEYWGLHNLRESFDKHYLASQFGLEADNIDILMHEEDPLDNDKVKIERIDGDTNCDEEYEAMVDWIEMNPPDQPANYQQLQTWVDVTNYTDYIIAETFFGNTDWPVNNCDFWRAHTNQVATCGKYGDQRWRWMLYDLDVSGEQGSDFDMFAFLSTSKMTGSSEPGFLINQLWKNMEYRNYFVQRYANLLNTTFRPGRLSGIIEQAAHVIEPEVEKHFRRWGRTTTRAQWRQAVNTVLVSYTTTRHAVSWTHLDDHFDLGGTGLLTVRNSNPLGTGGRFIVNGVAIDSSTEGVTNRAEWSGTYFRSLQVTVRAEPDTGYVFAGWEGRSEESATLSLFVTGDPLSVMARFLPETDLNHTVIFDAGAGTVDPAFKTVREGAAYGELPAPIRAGYVFEGWWTGLDGSGVRVDSTVEVSATTDHTLHAKWTVKPPEEPYVVVGMAFEMALPDVFAGEPKVTVKGLPPGLNYNATTRVIGGVPTKAGTYSVLISATGVETVTVTLTVVALPAWAQGAFNGYVEGEGLASMSVTVAGKVTGKILMAGTNYTFSSVSYAAGGSEEEGFSFSTVAKAGRVTLPLELCVAQVGSPLTVGAVAGIFDGGLQVALWRNVWQEEGETLAPLIGYYTATLSGNAEYGSGYLTFTVDKTGKVKVGGKLADGMAVSQSGTLVLDEVGGVFAVVYAAPSAYKGGGLFGLAEFIGPDTAEVSLRPLDDMPFAWRSRNPQATGDFGVGFDRTPGFAGGWFSKTDNLYTYYVDKDLSVGTDTNAPVPILTVGTNRYEAFWWNPEGVTLAAALNGSGEMTGLTAPKAGTPTDTDRDGVWDYSSENTVGLKVALTVATGVFKGSFKAWFDYPVKKHTSRTVSFEGVVTPEREDRADGIEGRGYFLWPDKAPVPSTATTYPFKWSYDFLLLGE